MTDLVVALLSDDDNLANVVNSTVEVPWRLEHQRHGRGTGEFAPPGDVRLVIVDDEGVSEGERGWLLAHVKRNLSEVPLLYIAGRHTIETELRARCKGATYYTAKPIQSDEFTGVLRGFMNRAARRDACGTSGRTAKELRLHRSARLLP
jgi:DNA-binding response OmpR family regulator